MSGVGIPVERQVPSGVFASGRGSTGSTRPRRTASPKPIRWRTACRTTWGVWQGHREVNLPKARSLRDTPGRFIELRRQTSEPPDTPGRFSPPPITHHTDNHPPDHPSEGSAVTPTRDLTKQSHDATNAAGSRSDSA